MENEINSTSSYFIGSGNGSEEINGTFLPQFPFSRGILSLWIIVSIFNNLSVVAIHLALLVAMLKTKRLRRPINFIHMSILASQIVSRLIYLLGFFVYVPPAWTNCQCSIFTSYSLRTIRVVVSVYEPVAFAFLSLMQLFIIKGKRILGKIAAASICFSLAYGAVFAIEYIVLEEKDTSEIVEICSDTCTRPNDQPPNLLLKYSFVAIFLSFLLLAWIPSLIIVAITATWSCLIFKKSYTGGDDQLNKRILSIPFIMPAVVIGTNFVSIILVRALVDRILLLFSIGNFQVYWSTFLRSVTTSIIRAFIGFFYAILLLYLMPPLRQALRKFNSQTVVPGEEPSVS